MKFLIATVSLLLISFYAFSQSPDTLKQEYLSTLKKAGREFSAWFYPNRDKLYALPERDFVTKIDSARAIFDNALNRYQEKEQNADASYLYSQQKEIHYFFERFILDYPYFHDLHSTKKTRLSAGVQKRLDKNLTDFNNPGLLSNPDFRSYIDAFLHEKSNIELKKTAIYKKMDNQRLNSVLRVIPIYFTEPACRSFWQYQYIYNHLDDWGSKNVENIVSNFLNSCKDTSYTNKISAMYADAQQQRSGHLVKTYKKVNGFGLDMHLFLPDSPASGQKRPVMIYFSGGSWTKGNPEWSFSSCESYAKKGWVSAAVEYRLADRHGTTPFDAVKDARSGYSMAASACE